MIGDTDQNVVNERELHKRDQIVVRPNGRITISGSGMWGKVMVEHHHTFNLFDYRKNKEE